MSKIIINLVTHSAYKDVCLDFLKLFEKNWSDCPYDFVISVVGENIDFGNYSSIYHGKKCSLPEAVYNVMTDEQYEYCISFLGDAFINEHVDNKMIEELLKKIRSENIQYCCLIPRKSFRLKNKLISQELRYISSMDSYNMSFVAFIASRDFIKNEFANGISDLDFETKYLMNNDKSNIFYKDRAIVTKNVFHLAPGINAGKWNRHVYKKLRRDNPEITFNSREVESFVSMIRKDMISVFQILLSKKQRKTIKRLLTKIFKIKFVTDY